MIEIFEGRLGGGKTYSSVVRIVDHLRKGHVVATNIALNADAIIDYCAQKFSVRVQLGKQLFILPDEQIAQFHKVLPRTAFGSHPVLAVIDEAHLWFNARDWNQTSRDLLSFLTQSRKLSVDVIFISQSALNIDKQFARLIQYVWRFRDMEKFKIPGLSIPWPMKQILAVQFDYDGKTVLERFFRRKDPAIFALYNTQALLKAFPDLDRPIIENLELEKIQKKPFFDKKTIKIYFLWTLLFAVIMIKFIWLKY